MGKFDFQIPVEFMKSLGRLADVEKYAPDMLEAAAPIVERSVKSALSSVTSGKATGEMVRSVKKSKVFHNKNGYYLTVRPTGQDKNGTRNMEKAAYLEFGTSQQTAKPWASKAMNDCKEEALNKMREVFEREAEK